MSEADLQFLSEQARLHGEVVPRDLLQVEGDPDASLGQEVGAPDRPVAA